MKQRTGDHVNTKKFLKQQILKNNYCMTEGAAAAYDGDISSVYQ
jgi:hypothetical protein